MTQDPDGAAARPIRVLVADDQKLIRAGFHSLIDTAPDLEVVAEASNGREALQVLRSTPVDVVLMDIRMPDMDGVAATRHITADPALQQVKVLILTTFELDEYVFQALRAGASGFLGKGVEPGDLHAAIRTVAAGEALLSPRATGDLIRHFLTHTAPEPQGTLAVAIDSLTDREREIVALVAAGKSNTEIAGDLHISPLTAKTHINRSMIKLAARDRAQLVVIAIHNGLAPAR